MYRNGVSQGPKVGHGFTTATGPNVGLTVYSTSESVVTVSHWPRSVGFGSVLKKKTQFMVR